VEDFFVIVEGFLRDRGGFLCERGWFSPGGGFSAGWRKVFGVLMEGFRLLEIFHQIALKKLQEAKSIPFNAENSPR
jgi:hypothetical protein